MVFPSIPIYADTPNWNQQQQSHDHGPGTNISNYTRSGFETIQLPPIALTSNPAPNLSAPDPTSLSADRVRPTRLPHPESGLNCPRCNSTNTKFCYFNNYSLSQPRHFCRACRRYWTRGGNLRNIPVGGGSRRNKKRNKPTPSIAASAHTGTYNSSNANIHHFGASSSSGTGFAQSNIGLRYSGMQMQLQMPFTGAFESTHGLPFQLGAGNHAGLISINEELLGVRINTDRTGMERGGSQAYHTNFNASSLRNSVQPHGLFNQL